MAKLIVKHFIIGIAGGCFILAVNLLWWDFSASDQLQYFFNNITADVLGYIIVGIGLFGGGIVYEIERLSFILKLAIHMFTGISLLLLVGFNTGWFVVENPSNIVFNILLSMIILFIVWVVCYFCDKRKVEKINKKILERNLRKPLDTE